MKPFPTPPPPPFARPPASPFPAVATLALMTAVALLPLASWTTPAHGSEPSAQTEANVDADPYAAVVRVENSAIQPDYATPWNAGSPRGGSGSGFYIGDNRFLTNAHVVSNSARLVLRKIDNPQPLPARVKYIAHDCDLAMLELIDPTPFEDVEPMQIGGVPRLDTEVLAVGYPIGGERLSVTRGVVSRIDFVTYAHSAVDQHLAIQIDAAINPGNSGGPILQDGKAIGVAFQGVPGALAQNVGYIIPTPVVERFLTDVESGSYDHYVDLAISDFAIQNPAQIQALGLPDDGIGVMVANADSAGSAAGAIHRGDVILAINGSPVFNNGLIRVDGEFVNMNEIVERKFAGDVITLKVWRDRQEIEVDVELKRYLPYLIQANQYDQRPRYSLYAGLLFQPLDRNLLAAHNINNATINYFFNYYTTDELYMDHPEVVLLTQILPDAINNHFGNYNHRVVKEINGTRIRTLQDAHDALRDADADERGFLVIRLHDLERPLVLDREDIDAAHARILERYGVPEDHFLGNGAEPPPPAPDHAADDDAN